MQIMHIAKLQICIIACSFCFSGFTGIIILNNSKTLDLTRVTSVGAQLNFYQVKKEPNPNLKQQ